MGPGFPTVAPTTLSRLPGYFPPRECLSRLPSHAHDGRRRRGRSVDPCTLLMGEDGLLPTPPDPSLWGIGVRGRRTGLPGPPEVRHPVGGTRSEGRRDPNPPWLPRHQWVWGTSGTVGGETFRIPEGTIPSPLGERGGGHTSRRWSWDTGVTESRVTVVPGTSVARPRSTN